MYIYIPPIRRYSWYASHYVPETDICAITLLYARIISCTPVLAIPSECGAPFHSRVVRMLLIFNESRDWTVKHWKQWILQAIVRCGEEPPPIVLCTIVLSKLHSVGYSLFLAFDILSKFFLGLEDLFV